MIFLSSIPIPPAIGFTSSIVNRILSFPSLANWAKTQAKQMMIQRAHQIGVDWLGHVALLNTRDWSLDLSQVTTPGLSYPDYYVTSFHGYADGNLSWEAAFEVEVAAYAVHSRVWGAVDAHGDARLRQSYHQILQSHIPSPLKILDLGCSVGMSTAALQVNYPGAEVVGIDLSPYFLSVAQHQTPARIPVPSHSHPVATPTWLHAAAEATGLPDQSFDLVSGFLLFHELPEEAAIAILREVHRLLRPGGYFAMMDMNPQSPVYAQMKPFILTLLKSTEPYLDEYFNLDFSQALHSVGFQPPTVVGNSPRHRTIIARR